MNKIIKNNFSIKVSVFTFFMAIVLSFGLFGGVTSVCALGVGDIYRTGDSIPKDTYVKDVKDNKTYQLIDVGKISGFDNNSIRLNAFIIKRQYDTSMYLHFIDKGNTTPIAVKITGGKGTSKKGWIFTPIYLITFNSNGGDITPQTQEILRGTKVTKPLTNPTKEGYIFDGWYKEKECANVWDFDSDTVTDKVTLYAKWTPIPYTITYENLLDGTNPNTINSYTIEDTITFENPIRTGYTGSWDIEGITSGSTGNKTITAVWEINKYKVTFKDYDGSILKAQENVEYNTGATAPSNPTRDHYTFTGWDKSFNNVTEDLVVTAQYIADKNTVTFDSNGGSAIDSQLVDYGSKVTKPSNPTNGNLHFIGWFVNPTLENIFNEETFDFNTFDFNTEITGNTTLTALWATRLNVNTYGDGQIATASHGEELVFDDEHSITSVSELAIIGLYDSFDVEAKANEGYHFVKWTKDGVDYSKNSKVTITLEDDIVELVAVFEVDEFTVTFKDYDGSTIDTQQVAYYTSAFEPDAPTRDGYTFTGWDKSFDNVTKDLVVTAQYVLTPGEVEVKEVKGNVGSATVSLNNQNVEDLIELSDDEKNAIATGKDIYVFVEVGDISDSVSIKDKELVKTKLEDGSVVGMYLDINLFKQIEGENKIKVEETNDKIKISFEIPEGLRSSNREFYIIRAHGSEVTKIVPSINGNILTFETDRFSTYALAYTDPVEETTSTQTNTTSSPKTGDNAMLYISMLGLSIIGFIGTGLYVIKKRFN